MKRILWTAAIAAVMAGVMPAAHAGEAPAHPVAYSAGGEVTGLFETVGGMVAAKTCGSTVDVQITAHYVDLRTGTVGNRLLLTSTSTCSDPLGVTTSTVIRLFRANGAEIGTPTVCSADVCQREAWVYGNRGERVFGAGAGIWKLTGAASAWSDCQAVAADGVVQGGYCSPRTDPKWAAVSSYADWYLA